MLDKIIFLCVNPWELLFASIYQSCGREYFQWICQQAKIRNIQIASKELVEIYGELQNKVTDHLFSESEMKMQFLYVQTNREEFLEKVFKQADLVIMGVPGNKKAFDRIYMSVFPWIDQIMFLWDQQVCKGEAHLKQLCREYKIREAQMIELERGLNGMLKSRNY